MSESSQAQECTSLSIENGIIISLASGSLTSYIHGIKLKSHHKPKRKKHCFLCRSQTNSLLLVLGAYVTIFSIASIILVMSVFRLQNLNDTEKLNLSSETNEAFNVKKYHSVLKEINGLFKKKLFKEFMWPFKSSVFNCSCLSNVRKFQYLTSGWTKNVFSFEYNGKSYALKTVNVNGIDMKNCTEKHSLEDCFEKISSKMYKEYILSQELSHTNIIKVLAWCFSGNNISNDVAVITELCSPIDTIFLLRMSFHQRLKIMLDLAQLIVYLANSPLGSVAINDFQRQQFVMCGKTLKLTDLDDLSIEEPKCNSSKQCSQGKLMNQLKLNDSIGAKAELDCKNNICLGYNEKQNIINTYKHFVNLFLNITAPSVLKESIEELFDIYTTAQDARKVLRQTEVLHVKYKNFQNGMIDN